MVHTRRLLAFGDSLTAGYTDAGESFHPWAPLLQRKFGLATADHIGLSGWTTAQMVQHLDATAATDVCGRSWPGLRRSVREATDAGMPYDIVVIMAGTNDLADYYTPEEVVANLALLHSVAHSSGAKSVAITIPESAGSVQVRWLRELRQEANAAVREWALAQPAERLMLVDSNQLLPYAPGRFWEPDGLHMSCDGYQTFGTKLAAAIGPFVLADSPGEAYLVAGRRVAVKGLQSAAEHNGKLGVLTSFHPDGQGQGRWGVRLEAGGIFLVRPSNLELVDMEMVGESQLSMPPSQ